MAEDELLKLEASIPVNAIPLNNFPRSSSWETNILLAESKALLKYAKASHLFVPYPLSRISVNSRFSAFKRLILLSISSSIVWYCLFGEIVKDGSIAPKYSFAISIRASVSSLKVI